MTSTATEAPTDTPPDGIPPSHVSAETIVALEASWTVAARKSTTAEAWAYDLVPKMILELDRLYDVVEVEGINRLVSELHDATQIAEELKVMNNRQAISLERLLVVENEHQECKKELDRLKRVEIAYRELSTSFHSRVAEVIRQNRDELDRRLKKIGELKRMVDGLQKQLTQRERELLEATEALKAIANR